jgi:hypothetical protein
LDSCFFEKLTALCYGTSSYRRHLMFQSIISILRWMVLCAPIQDLAVLRFLEQAKLLIFTKLLD